MLTSLPLSVLLHIMAFLQSFQWWEPECYILSMFKWVLFVYLSNESMSQLFDLLSQLFCGQSNTIDLYWTVGSLDSKITTPLSRFIIYLEQCLLIRSPVPGTMVLKSNRSGLWRHIIGTCRRLRWLCGKHSNIVARHDKTPIKLTLLSHDTNFMSHRNDIMLQQVYI